MSELSLLELEHETVELLPRREALSRSSRRRFTISVAANVNVVNVSQVANSFAISGFGDASSYAINSAHVTTLGIN